jgi:acetylornithine deacetylase
MAASASVLLERLVGFDTTSAKSNLALIDFAADLLGSLGASVRLTRDDAGAKANLFATLGPDDIPGVVLSGHTDVVPADGRDWRSDPFRLDRRDGRLYGRGTADMKGFLAACLAMAPRFAAAPLAQPVHFAFSFDEEVGCVGVRRLLADLENLAVRPRLCIVGEPTGMKVISGHKGKKSVRCAVHGKECHSAYNHQGVNAVEIAAEIIAHLRALQRRIREGGPFDHGFDPPYSTIHTGVVKGGTALNIVPKDCAFEFELRNLPTHDPEAMMAEIRAFALTLIPEMLAVDPAAGIMLDEHNTTCGLLTADDAEVTLLARQLSGDNGAGKVAYTTEAGLFAAAGIPAVVCGPGHIAQAHKPDEFLEVEQLSACEAFLERLLAACIAKRGG